jgi:hypothetical protein
LFGAGAAGAGVLSAASVVAFAAPAAVDVVEKDRRHADMLPTVHLVA